MNPAVEARWSDEYCRQSWRCSSGRPWTELASDTAMKPTCMYLRLNLTILNAARAPSCRLRLRLPATTTEPGGRGRHLAEPSVEADPSGRHARPSYFLMDLLLFPERWWRRLVVADELAG